MNIHASVKKKCSSERSLWIHTGCIWDDWIKDYTKAVGLKDY